MNETQRLEKLKTALKQAVIKTCEAESLLEEAADLADPVSERADEIWRLKRELNQLGIRILEASKF